MDVLTDPTAAIQAARNLPDLAERARAYGQIMADLSKLRGAIAAERTATVAEMHESGMSWTAIGKALDKHPQRAAQIGKGISGGHRTKAGDDST